MGKTLIVHNPAAGPLKIPGTLDYIQDYLRKRNLQATLLSTPFPREALYRRLQEGADRVLVAGGDGTLNMVVNYLMDWPEPPPLGVLPLGTANDFARGLGIESVAAGLEKAFAGDIIHVDVGSLFGRHFINVAAGGFLCEVAHGTDRRLKKTLGRLAYYLKGLVELSAVEPAEVQVKVDGREVFAGKIFLFLILNSPRAGNFPRLAPHASPDDGKMDLLIIKECPPPELMGVLLKVLSGRHIQDPNILYRKGEAFHMAGPREMVTDLDGEEGPSLPWQVEILPRRLKFLR